MASSCLTARGVRPSPQTFSRGKADFLEQQHVQAGLRQVVGGGRSCGTCANDNDIGGAVVAGGGAHGWILSIRTLVKKFTSDSPV